MSEQLSNIVVDAHHIQVILKRLMRQQPDNMLLATALNIAEHIDETAEDLLYEGEI
jgi:hypothetical protein